MTKLNPYLSFNGNAREAMNFYKDCFGGELTFMEVAGSPMEEHMPPEMRNSVLHSQLTSGEIVLMGSDMAGPEGIIEGNNASMIVNCGSEEETRALYDKLSAGGTQTHPVSPAFWGGMFGHCTDKYGFNWMVTSE